MRHMTAMNGDGGRLARGLGPTVVVEAVGQAVEVGVETVRAVRFFAFWERRAVGIFTVHQAVAVIINSAPWVAVFGKAGAPRWVCVVAVASEQDAVRRHFARLHRTACAAPVPVPIRPPPGQVHGVFVCLAVTVLVDAVAVFGSSGKDCSIGVVAVSSACGVPDGLRTGTTAHAVSDFTRGVTVLVEPPELGVGRILVHDAVAVLVFTITDFWCTRKDEWVCVVAVVGQGHTVAVVVDGDPFV